MTIALSSTDRKLPALALIALGALFATNAVSIDVPLVAIPDIAQSYEKPNGAAQIVTSVFFLGFGLGQIPLGLISDRIGRRPVLIAGLAMMLIGASLATIAPRFELLVAARFIQGLATASTSLLARAIIRDISHGREAAAMMSFLAATLAVMIFIMPVVAGGLLWLMGWRYVLGLLVVYIAGFGTLAFFTLPETISAATIRQARSRNPVTQVADGLFAFFKAPASIAATLYALFTFGAYFMFLIMGASLIVETYGLNAAIFSVVFALVALMQWVTASFNRRYVERIGVERMILFTACFLCFACLLGFGVYSLPAVPLWLFVFGASVFAFCNGLVFPNVMAIAMEAHPTRAGIASSIYGTSTSVGSSVIGLCAGALYDGTVQTMFLLSAISCLCALMVYAAMRRHLVSQPDFSANTE